VAFSSGTFSLLYRFGRYEPSITFWRKLDAALVDLASGLSNPAPATITLPAFTVATVPSAATAGRLIYVSNEVGGPVVCFSDGTNWLRVTDRAIASE
jgi:hypothetical protein